jgi:tyrosyl-tRNA synthetase
MSKSKGNYVGVTDSPKEMFGKLMSIPDSLMENYFTLLTAVPLAEVREILRTVHPRDAKERLASTLVARYYGPEAASGAAGEFRRVFSEKQKPADIPRKYVPVESEQQAVGLASTIVACGFASSTSQARRLIEQGAVAWGDQKITDPKASVVLSPAGTLVRVGKLNWAEVYPEIKPK